MNSWYVIVHCPIEVEEVSAVVEAIRGWIYFYCTHVQYLRYRSVQCTVHKHEDSHFFTSIFSDSLWNGSEFNYLLLLVYKLKTKDWEKVTGSQWSMILWCLIIGPPLLHVLISNVLFQINDIYLFNHDVSEGKICIFLSLIRSPLFYGRSGSGFKR